MTKLCIVDLDGVVADSTERASKAHDIALQKLRDTYEHVLPADDKRLKELKEYKQAFYTENAFYSPELVSLDALIDDAKRALETLRYEHDYELMFLTGRPETMRDATCKWLFMHNILFYLDSGEAALVMKASAFQFTKTTVWKAGMVQTLVNLYGATEVLIIDDEEFNLAEIQRYNSTYRMCKSLAEAIR